MTGSANIFGTGGELGPKLGKCLMTRMPEAAMPEFPRDGSDKGRDGREAQWVQGPGAIAPGDHGPRRKILHRTTSRVKFNRAIIVNGKLANGNKILNKVRSDQNIIKMKIP
jgi:hypothetical protein